MNKLLVVVLALCLPLWLAAEDAGDSSSRLAEIEARVEDGARRLERISKQVQELQNALSKAETELAALRKRERNSGDELRRVLAERDTLGQELSRLRGEFTRLWEVSGARLQALYMGRSRGGFPPELALGLQRPDFQKIAYYTDLVQEHDRAVLSRLTHAGKRIRDKKRSLDALVESRDRIQAELTAQRKEIAQRVAQQRRVIAELQAGETAQRKALLALRAQALRLETVVSSMTSGRDPGFYGSVERRPAAAPVEAFSGKGLEPLKGTLPYPVQQATVERRFGKQKIAGFADYVLSKGLEFSVDEAASVQAVAAGRVLYSGRMPGYGTILILDHGSRSYSLYGKLGNTLVRKGDSVSRGQKIAEAGKSQDGTGRLYFEIRKNGKPVDPAPFLALS